ncbi:MAG: DNA-directed RNA polymerase subunit beta, partial [Clostridia bacterium]|nr:DNA-directed RNA polymerase subunit beta [Clostridia bacterium]
MLNTKNIKKVKYGNNERYNFSKVKEVEVPYLLEIQKESYRRFIDHDIDEVLKEFSPITDYAGKAEIYFLGHTIEDKPALSRAETKRKGGHYSVPMRVNVRLVKKETGEAIESEVYFGDIPYMTDAATFIFNGIERVIVSQIVRSPSVYYSKKVDKTGRDIFSCTLNPKRGSWLEIEQKEKEPNQLRVCLDKGGKISLGIFLKCFGLTREQILDCFGDDEVIKGTLDKDPYETQHDALIELSRKTRPSEIPSAEATKQFIFSQFFSTTYYNLGEVGRFKVDKKLSLANRIAGKVAAEDIKDKKTVLVAEGETITPEKAYEIQHSGINTVWVMVDGKKHKVYGNNRVKLSEVIKCNEKELGITQQVYYPVLADILKEYKTKEERLEAIKANVDNLVGSTLTIDDILATVGYFLDLNAGM